MGNTVLKLDKVYKAFGKHEVIKNISLEVAAGEILGVIGASGSGKTTLLNMLIGFLPPTKGQVEFRPSDVVALAEKGEEEYRSVITYHEEVKQLFGFASQEPSFYGELTLEENLDLFGTLQNLSRDARKVNAKILLKLLGLYEYRKQYAKNLSGGMQKRLDIACSLVHDPKVLILDEPTADLDPHLRSQMWDLIKKINSKGTTIILSSHFLDELEEFCDRIAILHKGSFSHMGTPAELKRLVSSHEEIHIETLKADYDKLIKAFAGKKKYNISHIEDKGSELTIYSSNPHTVIEKLLTELEKHHDVLLNLHVMRPTLNEVFESIIIEESDKK